MIDVSVTLKSKTYELDSIGNQIETVTNVVVPIIRIEDVYANEFYRGSQAGFKPNLRVVISSLNYNNEDELTYMNKNYSIIRVSNINQDEVALVCEVKVGEN